MDQISFIASNYGIPIVEDAAESIGSSIRNEQTGTFGEMGVYSFNGNKIITTSGGGAIVCNDEEAKKRGKAGRMQRLIAPLTVVDSALH